MGVKFTLAEIDGGIVELRSGSWRWRKQDVLEMPAGTVDRRWLFLHREDDPSDRMDIRIDPADMDLPVAEIERLAAHPDERRFFVDGQRIRATQTEQQPQWLNVRAGVRFAIVGECPAPLGLLKPDELTGLVGMAAWR